MVGLVMLMRYSRTHINGELYLASTAVCMMEVSNTQSLLTQKTTKKPHILPVTIFIGNEILPLHQRSVSPNGRHIR